MACAMASSVTWSPRSSVTTWPEEKTSTRSQSPSSSRVSEDTMTTAAPAAATWRRMR